MEKQSPKSQINEIELKLSKVSQDYSRSFENIQRLVDMARNIQQTYIKAKDELKRDYLNLFFSKFIVKNRKIVSAIPSDQLKPLIKSGKITVRVNDVWLRLQDSLQNGNN